MAGPDIQTTTVRAYYAVIDAKLETAALRLGNGRQIPLARRNKPRLPTESGIGRPWEMFKAKVGKIE